MGNIHVHILNICDMFALKSKVNLMKCTTKVHTYDAYTPGKNIWWDPANPTWDPRCVPGGIPPGIMEHPAWDPTWDPAN